MKQPFIICAIAIIAVLPWRSGTAASSDCKKEAREFADQNGQEFPESLWHCLINLSTNPSNKSATNKTGRATYSTTHKGKFEFKFDEDGTAKPKSTKPHKSEIQCDLFQDHFACKILNIEKNSNNSAFNSESTRKSIENMLKNSSDFLDFGAERMKIIIENSKNSNN